MRTTPRRGWMARVLGILCAAWSLAPGVSAAPAPRVPRGDDALRDWLSDMVVDHGYAPAEVEAATGLGPAEASAAMRRLGIDASAVPRAGVRLRPYPGGRHPRLGFLEGAVDPVRDTKISVFTPWDPRGPVVVDVPEALWVGDTLHYLAHTHLPTTWDKAGVTLPPVEWRRRADGAWASERTLPDGVAFGVRARAIGSGAEFRMWVRNGGTNVLPRVRAQACVLLGQAAGFGAQSDANKLLDPPFAAARDAGGRRWVITAWEPAGRAWQNPPVPCIHSDPSFGDIPPGATREARGWVWFHEGDDVRAEIARLRWVHLAGRAPEPRALEPVPDKLVVLTFDDSVASLHRNVAPLLRKHGFGATFFITEGFTFATNKADYMTWEQIASLDRDGFEVGNHTRTHLGVTADTLGRLVREVEYINERCAEHGIPRPTSFAYPGNAIHPGALPLLRGMGFRFARRGAQPEHAYETGRGIAYEPPEDDPLLVPTTGDARPTWTLDDVRRAVSMARDGRVAVLQFHGVPDREHPWVNTPPERFAEYIAWLAANGYRCIAMRDLARYVDPEDAPADPWAVIRRRQAGP